MRSFIGLVLLFLLPFYANTQERYAVIIDEIMADPMPMVGLPNYEWVELKNISPYPVNLQNWRLGAGNSLSGPLPGLILQPDSFIIICSSNAAIAMSVFGSAVVVTAFPSLDNDGELIYLRSATGKTIHAVNYGADWYLNELKQEGGWSLEMIDSKEACKWGSNWKASINPAGGTPGKKNSVDGLMNNGPVPKLERAYTTSDSVVILVFDQTVDSLSASTISNYTIDGGLQFSHARSIAPLFSTVELRTNGSMRDGQIYSITAAHIKDCRNNLIETGKKLKVGLPADPIRGEWIINEILFNPRPNAFDFVEFYNNSEKVLDASKLYIANRNQAGITSSIKPLAVSPHFIFPGEYLVVTENKTNLSLQYLLKNNTQVFNLSSLPSFPDDTGIVVSLNSQGDVIDELRYNDDWHFSLLIDREGVSLERIDPGGPTSEASNWHSAASTAGYGTPGYRNSQYKLPAPGPATINPTPKLFSPDNDGHDDVTSIWYTMKQPGYIANVTIYDPAGRVVRRLVRNGTMGLSGYWNWNGLDDKGNQLPVGIYIIHSEIFNLEGTKQQIKTVSVLARKFQ